MLIVGDNSKEIDELKAHLCKSFQMMDIGELGHFIRTMVDKADKGIYLNQSKYALEMLKEIGLTDANHVDTPLNPRVKLTLEGSIN